MRVSLTQIVTLVRQQKAAATKAVVGVGGRCTPKEALKDTAADKVPDDGIAGKAVDAVTPEKKRQR